MYFKCDYCENNDICKYADNIVDLQYEIEDWEDRYIADNIITLNISCKRFKEKKC